MLLVCVARAGMGVSRLRRACMGWPCWAGLVGPAVGCLAAYFIFYPRPLWAQRADSAAFDRQGDFLSSRIRGNRGFYQQRYWLVVDTDRRGLNCRDQRRLVARFGYGDVLMADVPLVSGEAITQINGYTYLRIADERSYLRTDGNKISDNKRSTCLVRANVKYIAPINMDDFTTLKRQW
jgi:hypothetical protein